MIGLVDIDGVLTDFVGGILKLHGIRKSVSEFYEPHRGNWHIENLLGMDKAAFWKPVQREFWANLEWLSDGMQILQAVEERFGPDNTFLWTSPIYNDGCYDGKRDWIRRHLPRRYHNDQLVVGKAKFLGADPSSMLIDDGEHNTIPFLTRGGRVCLVPRLWNSDHVLSSRALEFVKSRLWTNS